MEAIHLKGRDTLCLSDKYYEVLENLCRWGGGGGGYRFGFGVKHSEAFERLWIILLVYLVTYILA